MQETAGENLIELVDVLSGIDTSPEKIELNSASMLDSDGNIIEY